MNKFLDGINLKVKKIIHSWSELKKINKDLNKDLHDLNELVNIKDKRIKELEDRIKLLNIAKSVKPEDKKNVSKELNQIIKMVDDCMMSLNVK